MINVKRYYGRTAREALRLVKEELGPDAVVLSNRAVDGGVEILALPADEVGAVQAAVRPQPAARPASAPVPAARPAPAVAARPAAAARPVASRPVAPARPVAAQPAAPRPAVSDEEEDFLVSLSTRVARSAEADEAYGKGLAEGVPHMVSDRHAEIRPFIPPRVDHYGNPVEPPLPRRSPEPIWAQREELRAEAAEPAPVSRPAPREELSVPAVPAAAADSERVRARSKRQIPV